MLMKTNERVRIKYGKQHRLEESIQEWRMNERLMCLGNWPVEYGQWSSVHMKVNAILVCVNREVSRGSRELLLLLCTALMEHQYHQIWLRYILGINCQKWLWLLPIQIFLGKAFSLSLLGFGETLAYFFSSICPTMGTISVPSQWNLSIHQSFSHEKAKELFSFSGRWPLAEEPGGF